MTKLYIIYGLHKQIKEYELIHENKRLKFNALLTTYEILLKDAVSHRIFSYQDMS